jgi:hypothetical protein
VAIGNVGELHVADARQQSLDRAREIAFHDLHMENVVLQPGVVRAGGVEDFDRLARPGQEKSGHRARVHRLDHQADAGRLQAIRCIFHVPDQRVEMSRARRILRHDAGKTIEPRTANELGILDRTVDALAEFAVRSGRHAMPRSPFAASPAGTLCSTTSSPAACTRSAIDCAGHG